MAPSLGYVIVYARDLAASIVFYRDVVGLALKFEDAGYAEFATETVRFALYERRRADWLTNSRTAPGPAAEVVFMVDDVDAEARRLRELGATILSGPADRPCGDTGRCISLTRTGLSWSSHKTSHADATGARAEHRRCKAATPPIANPHHPLIGTRRRPAA
jgi:lactoylglutathione lyase